jgi:hypothetical protein
MPNNNPIGLFLHFSIGVIAAGCTSFFFKTSNRLERLKRYGGFDIIVRTALISAFYLIWSLCYALEFKIT